MPKFKLKSIISRVVLGESRRDEDYLNYLCTGSQRKLHFHAYSTIIGRTLIDNDSAHDDDGYSISTTATGDDLPGTGRIIDTHVFQPMGRQIERLAMRFTIASLHPSRIVQYIETEITLYSPFFDELISWKKSVERACRTSYVHPNRSTIVAGMKGLVKQTQCVPQLLCRR